MASQLRSSLCVGLEEKENDNGANSSTRDCLEESETSSTSATLGADHSGFSNRSLFGSGIDFHPRGIVLGHDIQLGNTSRWSSRLVRVGGMNHFHWQLSEGGLLLMLRHFAERAARF